VVTDDSGKLKAVQVTSADGSPCPGPEPRKRRPKKSANGEGKESGGEDGAATSGDEDKGDDAKEGEDGEGNKKGGKKPRRRKRNGAKKGANGTDAPAESERKKPETWEKDLEESVLKSMEAKNIKVDGGRAFLAIGDARVKLGTDGYAALAHSKAILAEGKWTVVPSGVVSVTWERVLKLGENEWAPSTVDDEKDVLITEINLADDSVQPTGEKETTDSLWGEDKADPKDSLEKNGFQMRKMILNAAQAGSGRRRGRGRRPMNKNKGKPAAAKE